MSDILNELKKDLGALTPREFYMKHIVKSYYWYFDNVLKVQKSEALSVIDEFKDIVSSSIGVSFNSVMMVGSGKIGYSLSPKKKFKAFEIDADSKNRSDIDIAIISNDLFLQFWDIYRKSYSVKYEATYKHIFREIYRGYINERNLREIDTCRVKWNALSSQSNKCLRSKLYLKHEITYRIYRSWEDFEDYNLSSLQNMKVGAIGEI